MGRAYNTLTGNMTDLNALYQIPWLQQSLAETMARHIIPSACQLTTVFLSLLLHHRTFRLPPAMVQAAEAAWRSEPKQPEPAPGFFGHPPQAYIYFDLKQATGALARDTVCTSARAAGFLEQPAKLCRLVVELMASGCMGLYQSGATFVGHRRAAVRVCMNRDA